MDDVILIYMHSSGEIDINGRSVTKAELVKQVSSRLEVQPDQNILIQPGQDVTLQEAVRLLDELGGLGVRNIRFMNDN